MAHGSFVVYDKDTGQVYDRFATFEEFYDQGNAVAARNPGVNLDGKHDPTQEVFDWRKHL